MQRSAVVWLAVFFSLWPVARSGAERPLRIVTFNVQCLQAPETNDSRLSRFRWTPARQAHLEAIANTIETLKPDIIALSEVTGRESIEQLVEILHAKGLDDYQGHHVDSQDRFSGFDVAFLTRRDPDRVEGLTIQHLAPDGDDSPWKETFTYTDPQGSKQQQETTLARHALLYLTLAGQKLGFLGLHLKSDPSDPRANARRQAEARIARRIIREKIVARGYLPIVLGDLNDYDPQVPDRDPERSSQTDVLQTLKNHNPRRKGAELFNTARQIRRTEDRFSSHWDRNENGAADSDDVYTMIDHILLPVSLAPQLRRTFICRLSDLSLSDHWPVVVDLDLPEAAE